jgi:hypothetical protein
MSKEKAMMLAGRLISSPCPDSQFSGIIVNFMEELTIEEFPCAISSYEDESLAFNKKKNK